MLCIYCASTTHIINSRPSRKTLSVWRRRKCKGCRSIFTTRENIDYAGALRIKTAYEPLQPFLRDKLLISVYRSLSHRKTALLDADSLCATIIASLVSQQQKGLLNTEHIIKTTHQILLKFDRAAATHYQAHHS
jgi:transcriptional regulator NrdR family protein